MLTMKFQHRPDCIVASLTGELQEQTVDVAEAELLTTLVTAPAPLRLVLDLTGVTFLDSRGVNLIAKTRFAVRSLRGSLQLVSPPGSQARKILHLTGFEDYLPVSDALAAAADDTDQRDPIVETAA